MAQQHRRRLHVILLCGSMRGVLLPFTAKHLPGDSLRNFTTAFVDCLWHQLAKPWNKLLAQISVPLRIRRNNVAPLRFYSTLSPLRKLLQSVVSGPSQTNMVRSPPAASPLGAALTSGGLVFLWRHFRNRRGSRLRPSRLNQKNSSNVELALAPCEAVVELAARSSASADPAEEEKEDSPRRWRWAVVALTSGAVAVVTAVAFSLSSPLSSRLDGDAKRTRDDRKVIKRSQSASSSSTPPPRADHRVRVDVRRVRGGVVAFAASVTVPPTANDTSRTRAAKVWATVRRMSLAGCLPLGTFPAPHTSGN
jgi:hypothetical protein